MILLYNSSEGYNENYILVTGFAQMPKGTTLYEVQKVIGFTMVVDKRTDIIIDASFTFIMDLTNQFISNLVRGYRLSQGIEPLLERIRNHFLTSPRGAINQAIRSAYERYIEWQRSAKVELTT